jgi:anti-sigma factor RsiW
MTTRQISIDEDDFQAFVDGQLPPEQRRAVMAYLAGRPDEATRMDHYRTLTEALHLAYDEVLYEPLPKRLRIEHYRGHSSWAGRYDRQEIETPAMSFAKQAATAHMLFAPDLRHPVEFGADQQDSLLVWLSERLGQAMHAPDLQQLGYNLVGGRLLPASGLPAAQLMYEDPDAQRITIYIRARWTTPLNGAHEGTVNFAGEGGVSMVYWIEGSLAYALIGPMDREQLFSAAKTIQQQLEAPVLPTPTPEQTAVTEKDAT